MVAEKFVPSLESLSSLSFQERNLGCPGNFAGMSRNFGGVQKVCAKKVRAHFAFPAEGFLKGSLKGFKGSLKDPSKPFQNAFKNLRTTFQEGVDALGFPGLKISSRVRGCCSRR